MELETYISLLRGINVSGHRLIKMTELKTMYETLGLVQVETHIQSGNVIFKTEDKPSGILSDLISRRIKDVFDMDVPVMVYSVPEFRHITDHNPFLSDKAKFAAHMYVLFVSAIPDIHNPFEYAEKFKQKGEEFMPGQRAIYLYLPEGYGKTKLTNSVFEKALGVPVTARNWTTTLALLNLANRFTLHLN